MKSSRGNKTTMNSLKVFWVFVLIGFMMVFSSIAVVNAADPTFVSVSPASQMVVAGEMFNVSVLCVPQQAVKAFELKVSFDASLLQATSVSEGEIFEGFQTFFNAGVIDNTIGTIVDIYDLIVGAGTVTEAGNLVVLHFTAKSLNGTAFVHLYDTRITNESAYLEVNVSSGTVVVTGGSAPPVTPPDEPVNPPPSSSNSPPSAPTQPVGLTLVTVGTVYSYSSAASDPDGDSVRLRFDWGDGSLSEWTDFVASNTSVVASHAWANLSMMTVRVIAQDSAGENGSWSAPLVVNVSETASEEGLPFGMFTVPENASSNQTVLFDTSGIYDPDGEIVSYQWDFGDGTTAVGENPVHTYDSAGTYTVTLTVTDDTGLTVLFTRVVSVVSAPGVPSGQQDGLLPTSFGLVLLAAVAIPVLIVLVVFRDNLEQLYLRKRIAASRRKLAPLGLGARTETPEIDTILDQLFAGRVDPNARVLSKESILGAYNDLIAEKREANAAYHPPDLSSDEIEKLVDQRIQAKIEEEVDKL